MKNKSKKIILKKGKAPVAKNAQQPSRSGEDLLKRAMANIKEKRKEKEERLAARDANPPDLTPRPCLVAFIDILGFGREIEAAKTKEELEKAYRKIRLVQKEFQKESAVDDPEEQAEMNTNYGRRVIALSDAVVVVITPNCPAGSIMGIYDHLGFAVSELIISQTRCAVSHGIFVRGALSHGSFFFEDDVLLSPALARAYELENEYAEYPLIVVPEETRQALYEAPKRGSYAKGADPTPQYFKRLGRRKWRDKPLYYLDYMSVMVNEDHRGWLKEDLKDYLDAKRKGDHERAQAAFNRRGLKDSAFFLEWHRKRIEDAYQATASERVRKKYRWLMKYHNRSFRHDIDYVRDQVIDLSKYLAS